MAMKLKTTVGALLLLLFSTGSTYHLVAQEAAPAGPTQLSETYDAWTVQCANTTQGEQKTRTCQMSLELIQQESRQRVMLFAINSAKSPFSAKATLVLPFGLLLSDGVRIEMEEKEVARGTFRTCLPAGCISEMELGDDLVEQMRTGEKLTVVVTANNGQATRMDVSLVGFGNAYQRLVDLLNS
jgi:invasion protein IalB